MEARQRHLQVPAFTQTQIEVRCLHPSSSAHVLRGVCGKRISVSMCAVMVVVGSYTHLHAKDSVSIATCVFCSTSLPCSADYVPYTVFWGPYIKDPTIWDTMLGSPIFGNPYIELVSQMQLSSWTWVCVAYRTLFTT